VIACTTYFGNGIQDWAHAKAQQQAGTSDPWFYTTETFDPGNGQLRPVSLPADHPYWRSKPFQRHLAETLAEWRRRMLGGSASEGGGPDATGFGGGFEMWLRQLALTTFPQPKPLVAYEGGPSLYTDYLDGGDVRDDGITTFMSALNRHGGIRTLYDIHLNLAKSKGLRTHSAFVDAGVWGKYGQWGHLEHWAQDAAGGAQALLPAGLDPADGGGAPRGRRARPRARLRQRAEPRTRGRRPALRRGRADDGRQRRAHGPGGGDEPLARAPHGAAPWRSRRLPPGGHALRQRSNYAYARVVDADGDPPGASSASTRAAGRAPSSTPTSAGRSRAAHALDGGLVRDRPGVATYGGLVRARARSARSATTRSRTRSTRPRPSPRCPGRRRERIRRRHAARPRPASLRAAPRDAALHHQPPGLPLARRYAVFTSVAGFAAGQEVFLSPLNTDLDEPRELVVALPDAPAYDGLASVQIRIYGYAANFGGHRTRLTAFKLSERVGTLTAEGRK
jgi:hypothetical protein